MKDDSPNRFDRIVAILIQLQSKKIVKANELAQRFGVSLRTIYRDIRTLEVAGVPIYSEAGIGYSLVEGYRLPPVMFSREEAESFIAAEKLMQGFTDDQLAKNHASAIFKLKAVLRSDDKDWVSGFESNVLVKNTNVLFNKSAPNALAIVFRSIASQTQLLLHYQAVEADTVGKRSIEPVGVFHENNNWYIYGYCHLRNDYRNFRTDRIHEIQETVAIFTRKHETLEYYLKPDSTDKIEIKILVDKSIVKYIENERKQYGFISEESAGDNMKMTFMCRDTENGFARWYMMFADYATIISPESVKHRVSELLELGIKNLCKK